MNHSITLYRHARPLVLEIDPAKPLWTNAQPSDGTFEGNRFVEAVRDSLLHPIGDFPPLTAALVGEDSIAIVVEADVPSPQQAIRGVLDALGLIMIAILRWWSARTCMPISWPRSAVI